jgi:hypothetical protein
VWREAFRRKALALDLAQVVSYGVAEEWHTYLFTLLQRDPPKGFRPVNLGQLIAADKRLWVLLSEKTRGNVAAQPGMVKPCDTELKTLSSSHEVTSFLVPLPELQERFQPSSRSSPYPNQKGKGKGKAKFKVHDGQPAAHHDFQLPDGCTLQRADGKPL